MKRAVSLVLLVCLLAIPNAFAHGASSYVELTDAPTINVDWSKGNTQSVTLHGNRVLTFRNGEKGGRYLLVITQDETGSRLLSWPSSVRWPGVTQIPSTLTTTAGKTDYMTFFFTGLTYDSLSLAQNY